MAQHAITTTHASIWSQKQVPSKSCQSAFSDPGIFGDVQPLSCFVTPPSHHTSYVVTPDSSGFLKVVLSKTCPVAWARTAHLYSGIHLPCSQHSCGLLAVPQGLVPAGNQMPRNAW